MLRKDARTPQGEPGRSAGQTMASGRVKWFNDAKGFGFIEREDGEHDVFFHFTAIQVDGYKTVAEGQRVEFDLYDGPKGPLAKNIQRSN